MAQPFEIISMPADVYVASTGEPAPSVDFGVPGGNWTILGSNGKRNQSTAGVKLTFSETLKPHTTAGATGNVKVFRTFEEIQAEMVIEDLTMETFAKAMNNAGITEIAQASGVAGYKGFGLKQGFDVMLWAMLIRLNGSPYGDGMNLIWWIPCAYENGAISHVYDSEGTVAGTQFKFVTLEDPNAANEAERFGRVWAQTAAALP
jgi:hypothetical protein